MIGSPTSSPVQPERPVTSTLPPQSQLLSALLRLAALQREACDRLALQDATVSAGELD